MQTLQALMSLFAEQEQERRRRRERERFGGRKQGDEVGGGWPGDDDDDGCGEAAVPPYPPLVQGLVPCCGWSN